MVGAAIGGVAGAIGSVASGSQASSGAKAGAGVSAEQLAQEQSNISPFLDVGTNMANTLQGMLSSGQLGGAYNLSQYPTFSWNPTEAGLQQTPGYQFTLNQGLQATQNAYAAQGLGVSGAALKGAASYATGLADSTYNQQLQNYISEYQQQTGAFQNQFNDYWANQQNQYNQLYNLSSLGSSAATGTAGAQAATAGNVTNALTTAGTSQAAGTQGATNSLANTAALGSTGSGSSGLGSLLQSMFAGSSGGSTLSTYTNPATGSPYQSSSDPNQNLLTS